MPNAAINLSASGDWVSMSRRLALTAKHVIGFLPVVSLPSRGGPVDDGDALLGRLASGLTDFVTGNVGVVSDWRLATTGDSPTSEAVVDSQNPRVFHVRLGQSPERTDAASSLRRVLDEQASRFSRLLVDLSGYAASGVLPAASEWMDGVVLLVPTRKARWRPVAELVKSLPHPQQLGVIVLD